MVLLHILAASQIQHKELLTPQELGDACGVSPNDAGQLIDQLVSKGHLSIGERTDLDGVRCNFFDMTPLWKRLQDGTPAAVEPPKLLDPVSQFEAEFGRPLSGFECEQIRTWMERDGHAEWMVVEALREAVLANKYSFKYIDRVLYDWHRNRIRTKHELDNYRQSYRERSKARDEAAAGISGGTRKARGSTAATDSNRDARYANFYQLFPDA